MGLVKLIGVGIAWIIMCLFIKNVTEAEIVLGLAVIFAGFVAHNDV